MGILILLGGGRKFNNFNHPVRLLKQFFDHILKSLWESFLVFLCRIRANGGHQDGFGIYFLFRVIVDANLSICVQPSQPNIRINRGIVKKQISPIEPPPGKSSESEILGCPRNVGKNRANNTGIVVGYAPPYFNLYFSPAGQFVSV